MKAVLVIFSQSGHTAHFARAIAEQFRKKGIETDIELLRPTKFLNPRSKDIEFKRLPEIDGYDIVCVGGPVWAFRCNPATIAYLDSVETLKGKRACAFVTHSLPFKITGPNRAIKKITSRLEALGAKTVSGEQFMWFGMPKPDRLEKAASNLVNRF
jgi:flavodoxin